MAKSTTWRSVVASPMTAGDMWRQCLVRFCCDHMSFVSVSDANEMIDDKMLMVWDLNPSISIGSSNSLGSPSADPTSSRPQPTAYVIQFPYPLSSVCAHPSTSKEFLVADARGSIFLTDWRSDPDQDSWRNQSVIELVEPRALADAVCGMPGRWSGGVAWRCDSVDMYVLHEDHRVPVADRTM